MKIDPGMEVLLALEGRVYVNDDNAGPQVCSATPHHGCSGDLIVIIHRIFPRSYNTVCESHLSQYLQGGWRKYEG